jgi:hypothetical protein
MRPFPVTEDMMITPRSRAIVSVVTLATIASSALALGACARNPAPAAWDRTAVLEDKPLVIVFDNQAETYVDVYLVGEIREWRLGRVAPGMRSQLRIPNDAQPDLMSGFVRLAVLAGSPFTAHVARDPRATFTIPEAASRVLAKEWTFRQSQVAAPEIFSRPGPLGRR